MEIKNEEIKKQLLKTRSIHNKSLLKNLGYEGEGSNTSVRQIINGNPTVKRLEPVADFFDVSMDIFFERSFTTEQEEEKLTSQMKIDHLESLLEEKNKRIETLELLVQVLNAKK